MEQSKSISKRVPVGWGVGILSWLFFNPLTVAILIAAMIGLSFLVNSTRWTAIGLIGGFLTMFLFGGLLVTFFWASLAILAIFMVTYLFLNSERGRLGKQR